MSKKRKKRPTTPARERGVKDTIVVRVPNPRAPLKERLKTPSHKVHRSKKVYRRKGKHPGKETD